MLDDTGPSTSPDGLPGDSLDVPAAPIPGAPSLLDYHFGGFDPDNPAWFQPATRQRGHRTSSRSCPGPGSSPNTSKPPFSLKICSSDLSLGNASIHSLRRNCSSRPLASRAPWRDNKTCCAVLDLHVGEAGLTRGGNIAGQRPGGRRPHQEVLARPPAQRGNAPKTAPRWARIDTLVHSSVFRPTAQARAPRMAS